MISERGYPFYKPMMVVDIENQYPMTTISQIIAGTGCCDIQIPMYLPLHDKRGTDDDDKYR